VPVGDVHHSEDIGEDEVRSLDSLEHLYSCECIIFRSLTNAYKTLSVERRHRESARLSRLDVEEDGITIRIEEQNGAFVHAVV
jgi:hypothetical protein